jgi:class 3 adenylate cyclase
MNGTGNKTIMCSVLFLDIVEYSKRSVAGQISLKNRFNNYLSSAICSVPIADRIILDTGDGAALNFLGDIEDALRTALSLRDSLLNEMPDIDPPLSVRMGINLGPVRLVMDINGLPNVVGDGVNVAQRIMGFAEPDQILLSRSYCDAVSHLSSRYAEMFHYVGSRTDKDVREHQIYAVGRSGDQAVQQTQGNNAAGLPSGNRAEVPAHFNPLSGGTSGRFEPAGTKWRAIYIVAIFIFVVLVGVLIFKFNRYGKSPNLSDAEPVRVVNQVSAPVKDIAADASAIPPAATGRPDIEPVVGGKKTND